MRHNCYDLEPLGRFDGRRCHKCLECGEIWISSMVRLSYAVVDYFLFDIYRQTLLELGPILNNEEEINK
jgi:hypothetical protein